MSTEAGPSTAGTRIGTDAICVSAARRRCSSGRTGWPGRAATGMMFVVAAIVLGVAGAGASMVMQQPVERLAVNDGAFRVGLATEAGTALREPYFDTAGAMPGMAPRTEVVRIENDGTVNARWRLSVAGLVSHGERSLGEVLEVTVRDPASNVVLYQGALSALDVASRTVVEPGEAAILVVAVSWPDTPTDDNPYQGARLSFALQVSAIQN